MTTPAAISPSEPPRTVPFGVHQRARGEARVSFALRDGRTVLGTLYQRGALKVRLPRGHGTAPEAVLINTAGGLTGGDRIAIRVEVPPGARATVTTQAAERIYRSIGDAAEVEAQLTVGAGGRLDWLPQETILFNRGVLRRRLDADLAEGAALLLAEAVIFGRRAMGEAVSAGALHDRWRVRRGGKPIFADDFRLEGDLAALLPRAAALAGHGAMASLLYVGDDAAGLVDPVRAALGDAGGASAFGGKLVARVVAEDGLALRRALVPALTALRAGAPMPRMWPV